MLECNKNVYAYASTEPLELEGKCKLTVRVQKPENPLCTEFYAMRGKAATLLGCEASKSLDVLKIGVSINSCHTESNLPAEGKEADKKAALRSKFPSKHFLVSLKDISLSST